MEYIQFHEFDGIPMAAFGTQATQSTTYIMFADKKIDTTPTRYSDVTFRRLRGATVFSIPHEQAKLAAVQRLAAIVNM